MRYAFEVKTGRTVAETTEAPDHQPTCLGVRPMASSDSTASVRVSFRAYEAERIINSLGSWCRFCGIRDGEPYPHIRKPARCEIEHLIPVSRGGSNAWWNLTMGCRSCNRRKGTKTAVEFGFRRIESAAGTVYYAEAV